MLINKIEVDEGRDIIIMDEAFKFGEHHALYDICMSLKYSCTSYSNFDIQDITDKRMRADLTQDDNLCNIIFNDYRIKQFQQFIKPDEYSYSHAYVNLGLVNDSHEIHVDGTTPGQVMTMLIYPNTEWELNHGGETVFYKEDRKEMVYLNPYKPGRICLFEGSIPHCAKPQALIGPKYRFTIAVKFFCRDIRTDDIIGMSRPS